MMQHFKKKISVLLPLLAIIFSGCFGSRQDGMVEKSTMAKTTNALITETIIPTWLPTRTLRPQNTSEPTKYIDSINDFLDHFVNCRPLCLLGVIPGQTTNDQARAIFYGLGHPLEPGNNESSTSLHFNNTPLSIRVDVSSTAGVVKNIFVSIADPQNYTEGKDWEAFAPDTILKEFGLPSRVELGIEYPHEAGFPENIAWYDLILKYDDLDFTIVYGHGLSTDGKFTPACPLSDKFSYVLIISGNDYNKDIYSGVPLEYATPLTLSRFRDLLTQNSEPACFQISKDAIFPE
jgi:hypothetical protein